MVISCWLWYKPNFPNGVFCQHCDENIDKDGANYLIMIVYLIDFTTIIMITIQGWLGDLGS